MQESLRTRRVAELLRKEISSIITNHVHDPKVHDVVITEIRVTKDMDLARVYFTSYHKEGIENIKKGLERSNGFIRRELIKTLHMKKVPRLEFIIDDIGDEAKKIDVLLEKLGKNE
ncbi:MAG: 30S ribosome-binding factor RbfA [Deferribacterales bacterium]|nr:30S ribosome-binding factor RbfA [Deferribacterales bacterium]